MIKIFYIILILLYSLNATSQENIINSAKEYIKQDFQELLFVSVSSQEMYHIKNQKIVKKYQISSSKFGTGNKKDSNQTPLGLHRIKHKYGNNVPINGIFKGRIFNGKIANIHKDNTKSAEDDITSRLFWLEGLEKNINKGKDIDSFNRYIYIHGTSEEGRIVTPSSNGCIRMKNKDIVKLYDLVEINTLVLIL